MVQGGLTGIFVGGALATQGVGLGSSLGAGAVVGAVGAVGSAAVAFVPVLVVTGLGVALHLCLF